MLIFTESQSVDHSPKAEPEPEHKKKDVKKAVTVKSVKDELANDADTGKFYCFNFYKFVLKYWNVWIYSCNQLKTNDQSIV